MSSAREAAIVIQGLRKTFVVEHKPAGTLKRAALNLLRPSPREIKEVLKGIDLRVSKGEILAVIGRNGSGKSTLLSLIARVYRPTAGKVEVLGSLAPLLELGAGFHPELTGAENVELYGAILGMTRRQIEERFESIVRFAFDTPDLIEKIDTTLRNYSDGMKMRLGFSIALHTYPEILLVDEVLAVGDEAFQHKCYRAIEQFHAQCNTILFVSHDMSVVRRMATRVVWLHHGEIRMDGRPDEVVNAYLAAADLPDFGVPNTPA